VPRVDFISSPGFLDGSPNARERAGLPRERVVRSSRPGPSSTTKIAT
jgi:hypothetical protein